MQLMLDKHNYQPKNRLGVHWGSMSCWLNNRSSFCLANFNIILFQIPKTTTLSEEEKTSPSVEQAPKPKVVEQVETKSK